MFQSFIYLSKRIFLRKHLFHESDFFVATSIPDVSQFVKMLWFMSLCYEILTVVLFLFFLCCYFSLSTLRGALRLCTGAWHYKFDTATDL